MKFVVAGFVAALAFVLVLTENHAGEKAKYTTKEVMAEAHKGGLMKKVATLKADDDEKKKLVELYTALSQNDPPKDESKKEWKKQTGDMLKAAKLAAEGDEKAAKSLLKLTACQACEVRFRK